MAESKYLDKEGLNRVWSRIKTGISWTNIKDKPSSFPPSSHNHIGQYYPFERVEGKIINYGNVAVSNENTHIYLNENDFEVGKVNVITIKGTFNCDFTASVAFLLPKHGSYFLPKMVEFDPDYGDVSLFKGDLGVIIGKTGNTGKAIKYINFIKGNGNTKTINEKFTVLKIL